MRLSFRICWIWTDMDSLPKKNPARWPGLKKYQGDSGVSSIFRLALFPTFSGLTWKVLTASIWQVLMIYPINRTGAACPVVGLTQLSRCNYRVFLGHSIQKKTTGLVEAKLSAVATAKVVIGFWYIVILLISLITPRFWETLEVWFLVRDNETPPC